MIQYCFISLRGKLSTAGIFLIKFVFILNCTTPYLVIYLPGSQVIITGYTIKLLLTHLSYQTSLKTHFARGYNISILLSVFQILRIESPIFIHAFIPFIKQQPTALRILQDLPKICSKFVKTITNLDVERRDCVLLLPYILEIIVKKSQDIQNVKYQPALQLHKALPDHLRSLSLLYGNSYMQAHSVAPKSTSLPFSGFEVLVLLVDTYKYKHFNLKP